MHKSTLFVIVAFEAGLFGNIQLNRFLMIQPEVLYETKGSQSFDGNIRYTG